MCERTNTTRKSDESGFALLSSLILLFLLSAIAAGVFYSTISERSNAGTDMQKNTAFYASEAAMEKMTSDLGNLYQTDKSPTIADITTLNGASYQPNLGNVAYNEYNIQVPPDAVNPLLPAAVTSNISSGPNAGLVAQIIKMQLQATATTVGASTAQGSIVGLGQVRMSRNIEVALIPVFQFGIFSQTDLDFFNGPQFNFGGRVFTNGNLFLATGNGLTFTSKVQAVKQVVRDVLANGVAANTNWNGNVDIPTAPNGCSGAQPACRPLQMAEESATQFFSTNPPAGVPNPIWTNVSTVTYGGMLEDGGTGVQPLNLPFVGPGVGPYEIIRRPYPFNENVLSPTGSSRLYNQAQIRILLDDNQANLPFGPQPGDVNLAAALPGTALPMAQGIVPSACPNPGGLPTPPPCSDPNWFNPTGAVNTPWPLISGWLRVEYRDAAGGYHNITQEWLKLGFARQAQAGGPVPNAELGVTNTVNPQAILLFQYSSDPTRYTPTSTPQITPNTDGWYPINMYDPREGETRDPVPVGTAAASCAVAGVINVIELDMDNLRKWLLGNFGTNGPNVDFKTQNGYIVYFSDRRGMQPDPFGAFPTQLDGEYGFTDVINIADPVGAPNNVLDTGEDVDGDGNLRRYGSATMGNGFNLPAANINPYTGAGRLPNCDPTARVNQVTGPRHAIKVVNGSLGHVPLSPNGTGGTTVASENPVYVQGNYNASTAAGFGAAGEAASAVIADAVTLLSINYTDLRSLQNPWQVAGRPAATSYYRLAIASGKNAMFPAPTTWVPSSNDYGTDGGVHNFLRYIENWGPAALNYQGSLVSFYYSRQAVGVFKCCTVVYSPPNRNYSFDQNFLDPKQMPPGTPRFQDIDNLGYHQDFRPQ
jgi:Tfp pilus assembly protein PilX